MLRRHMTLGLAAAAVAGRVSSTALAKGHALSSWNEAGRRRWTVVEMRADWSAIYLPEAK